MFSETGVQLLSDCRFASNRAGNGGGLLSSAMLSSIVNGSFVDNSSLSSSGGAALIQFGTYVFTNCFSIGHVHS